MVSDLMFLPAFGGEVEAEELATVLAANFLRRGNYNASSGPIIMPGSYSFAAAAANDGDLVKESFPPEFYELQVQSIGYEVPENDLSPAVHIYLTRGSARQMKSLPQNIAGVPIKTHKMGPINVRPDSAASSTNRGYVFEKDGRVCCGSSCAPTSENCAGTLGALVRHNGTREILLLSNNHVFAGCNHVPPDQPILSPASMDGRPGTRAPGAIGKHAMIIPLASGSPNFVTVCEMDVALARVTHPDLVSSWQGDETNGYDTPTKMNAPRSGMRVQKFGRTTGLTEGLVEAKVNTPTPITYSSKHFKGVVWFTNVWTVRSASNDPFALGGDSGSLIVCGDEAVGMVFAASQSGEYAWIVPMDAIGAAFGGLTLVGNHGV